MSMGAQWIVLPEFFTSGLAWDPRMRDAWQPLDGKPMQMLKELAKEGGAVVSGFVSDAGRERAPKSLCSGQYRVITCVLIVASDMS